MNLLAALTSQQLLGTCLIVVPVVACVLVMVFGVKGDWYE
jgi:hypothetical protein